MSATGLLGAASGIKNLDRIVLYIIAFIGFIVILIALGVAGLASSISWVIGLFIIAFGGYAIIRGKIPWEYAIIIMFVGAFITIMNPSQNLSICEVPIIGRIVKELTQVDIFIKEVIM